jgi:hypothetical protein
VGDGFFLRKWSLSSCNPFFSRDDFVGHRFLLPRILTLLCKMI